MKNNPTVVDPIAAIDAEIAREQADPELQSQIRALDGAFERARQIGAQSASDATHLGARIDEMESMLSRIPAIIEDRTTSLDRIRLLADGIDEVSALRLHRYDSATDDLLAWAKTAKGRIEVMQSRYRLAKTKAQEAEVTSGRLEVELAALRKQLAVEKPPGHGWR